MPSRAVASAAQEVVEEGLGRGRVAAVLRAALRGRRGRGRAVGRRVGGGGGDGGLRLAALGRRPRVLAGQEARGHADARRPLLLAALGGGALGGGALGGPLLDGGRAEEVGVQAAQ